MPSEKEKPPKPYKDFPLFAHARGYWAKKIRGRHVYFATWEEGWQVALERYKEQADALHAGLDPEHFNSGCTVSNLVDYFLTSKQLLVQSGDITERTFYDYQKTCRSIVGAFTKTRSVETLLPVDFEQLRASLAERLGPVALTNEITRVRTVFKYAFDSALIENAVRYGSHFRRPSARLRRLERAKRGERLFTPEQLWTLYDAAGRPMRAMLLLGINCGLGNADCGNLPTSAVDMTTGWLNYPRPKTGIDRRAKLWPETIEALARVRERTKAAKGGSTDRFFVTKQGNVWAKDSTDNPVTKEFRKLLDETKVYRKGLGFYALRHTFATVAGESCDQVAVNHIMGHAPLSNDMSAVYRESISDARLERVANGVREWLGLKTTAPRTT